MASINYATREISCKIVYYGPGLSGKTTNLQIIHRKIPDKDKSEMVSLATETDRTLFFDFLPLDLGSIKGFSTKFQLYTVPGQVYYNATRKLVLRGVDGVVFVVDSQVDKLQENLESFANLQENLREYGHSIENIPLVLQFNKRDLPNVYPVQQLNALINKHNLPFYEAVAATGVGVFTTLKAIGKSVIDKFNAKYAGFQGTRRPAAPGAPQRPAGTPAAPAAPQRPAAPPAQNAPAFGSPGPQAPNPFAGTPPRPSGPQPFPGNFGAPPQPGPRSAPAPGGFGSSAPAGGNPFMTSPPGMPGPSGFPGSMPAAPKPAPQGAPGFGAPSASPFGNAAPAPGFGNAAPNPFAGNPPAAPKPGAFPGAPASGPGGFPPFPGPKPAAPGPGAQAPGGLPQSSGNPGFQPPGFNPPGFQPPGFQPPPGIPVSPFVETFGQGRPNAAPPAGPSGAPPAPGGFGAPPAGGFPGVGAPPGLNPFAAPPKQMQPMPGFGTPPPAPGPAPRGGNFASPFPGNPGGQGPVGGGPGPGFPPSGGFGGPLNPPSPGFGGPAFEGPGSSLTPPGQAPMGSTPFPNPEAGGPGSSRNAGGFGDASGIVTTFEDLQKDDSFKTKKLPHPNEKKKGFFDGLFRKDK